MSAAPQAPVRELGLRDVVLFNIAAVVSIRWLATAAHIGPGSILLWAGAAVFFFVPLALAVAGLTARYPEAGGLYAWTSESFGEWHGFLCGWLYWVSNLFYFPNLLVAGVGMALFTFGAQYAGLAENRAFMLGASLVVLWAALLTNLVGMRVGKWTQNLGGLATMVAGIAVIGGGLYSLALYGPAAPLVPEPEWNWNLLNFWSQIAFAFGGLELGAILSREIRDPSLTVRRAAWISGVTIGGFYVLGTLALLALLTPERISVVTGLAQAGDALAARFGMPWLTAVLAVLIAVGILGQFGAWVGGSARLAFQIGLDRYLPPSFGKLHPKWGTPHVALLTQGLACTLFLVVMQMGETVRTAYQLLVDMTVISYFVPFLYLFATAWKHGQRWSAAAGLIVTAAGIGFSFVPPEGVHSVWLFESKLVGSCVVLGGMGWALFARARR
ncbi:MAG: amino acid permease [Bryobacterales bacterium]|nr:amino acid permease [Bryobacterales bacterium]